MTPPHEALTRLRDIQAGRMAVGGEGTRCILAEDLDTIIALLDRTQDAKKALEMIADALELTDQSVEGTEFQGYSRAMFRIPDYAKKIRKVASLLSDLTPPSREGRDG